MYKNELEKIKEKQTLDVEDFNEIFEELINPTFLAELIEDQDLLVKLLLTDIRIGELSIITYGYNLLCIILHTEPSFFPKLMENLQVKKFLIEHSDSSVYYQSTCEYLPFCAVLAKKTADINFQIIINDPQLKKAFCESLCAGRALIYFARKYPEKIRSLIIDKEIKVAITKDSHHYVAIQHILLWSRDKKDADMVFDDSTFGGWDEKLKNGIYNIIAKNYRNSLPNSLYKSCLLFITNPDNRDKIPKARLSSELEESIRNSTMESSYTK